jgi:hypothetical protein
MDHKTTSTAVTMTTSTATMAQSHQYPSQDALELQAIQHDSVLEQTDDSLEPSSDRLVNVATVEPVPPNGGYGWVCTFAVLLINAHTWGINAVRDIKRNQCSGPLPIR